MENMVGFPGNDRYQTIAVRRNLNRRFWNDWTFSGPHVWRDLSAQSCRQMPQVFIYTDESYNGQWPHSLLRFYWNITKNHIFNAHFFYKIPPDSGKIGLRNPQGVLSLVLVINGIRYNKEMSWQRLMESSKLDSQISLAH